MPHIHVSGLEGLITVLYIIAIMGAINLVAKKYAATNKLAGSYAYLFGL